GLSPAVVARSRAVPPPSGLVTPVCPVLQPRPDESGRFGLVRVRSPLLTESLLLSFPPGTEMFQFPGSAAAPYGFRGGRFGYPGLSARLTAPPGFSQSSTPFLASWRPDIPHTPLVAWPHGSRPPPPPVSPPGRAEAGIASKVPAHPARGWAE